MKLDTMTLIFPAIGAVAAACTAGLAVLMIHFRYPAERAAGADSSKQNPDAANAPPVDEPVDDFELHYRVNYSATYSPWPLPSAPARTS